MKTLTVKDLMVKNPTLVNPDATLQEAAVKMKGLDCGILPVGKKNEVTGIITDRDIVIRALSTGKDPMQEKVRDYMTAKILFCKETDTIEEAATDMKKNKVSRLLVKNGDNVTGILSFGHILRAADDIEEISNIVTGIKRHHAA